MSLEDAMLWKEIKTWAKSKGYETLKDKDDNQYYWAKLDDPDASGVAKSGGFTGLQGAAFVYVHFALELVDRRKAVARGGVVGLKVVVAAVVEMLEAPAFVLGAPGAARGFSGRDRGFGCRASSFGLLGIKFLLFKGTNTHGTRDRGNVGIVVAIFPIKMGGECSRDRSPG
jgi:hypothetical protein